MIDILTFIAITSIARVEKSNTTVQDRLIYAIFCFFEPFPDCLVLLSQGEQRLAFLVQLNIENIQIKTRSWVKKLHLVRQHLSDNDHLPLTCSFIETIYINYFKKRTLHK